jgi:hypothetical protein
MVGKRIAVTGPWFAGEPVPHPNELFGGRFLHERIVIEARMMDVFAVLIGLVECGAVNLGLHSHPGAIRILECGAASCVVALPVAPAQVSVPAPSAANAKNATSGLIGASDRFICRGFSSSHTPIHPIAIKRVVVAMKAGLSMSCQSCARRD